MAEYLIEAGEVLSSKRTLSLLQSIDRNAGKLEKFVSIISQLDDRVIDNLFDLLNVAVLITDTLTEDMIDKNVKIIGKLGNLFSKFTEEDSIEKLEKLIDMLNKLDIRTLNLLSEKAETLNSPEFMEIINFLTDGKTLKLAVAASRSLEKTDFSSPKNKFSLLKAIKIIRKPEIRKTIGALIDFAEEFQKNLN